MRRFLLFFTLIFILENVIGRIKNPLRNRPYLLGLGLPGHLSNVPSFLRLVGGRARSSIINHNLEHEYPIDFQSMLNILQKKINTGSIDDDEAKFLYDGSGLSCSHGANFTVDPHPERDWECESISCYCITKNSYLCSYERKCSALLYSLNPKENNIIEHEHEIIDDNNYEGDYQYDGMPFENTGIQEEYSEQNVVENIISNDNDDYNDTEPSNEMDENEAIEIVPDEVDYQDYHEYHEETKRENEQNYWLCEEGSVHRMNNFHTPPCMVCLCLDHWTLFCATKTSKQCLLDNNRDEDGQIINEETSVSKGFGIVDDTDLLKSALDEIATLKEWAEDKKLYDSFK